jgi:outer membrane immunogenic protein
VKRVRFGFQGKDKIMKKLLVGFAATAALIATPAVAADLGRPAPAPYYKAPPASEVAAAWAGFYVGIEGGWGWGRTEQTDATGFSSGRYDVSGGLIGGTLGYNWQASNIVFGLEGDGSWADINGSTTGGGFCGGASPNCSAKLDALGTVRGRLGLAFNNLLPYVTGGLAVGDLHGAEGDIAANGAFGAGSATVTGWTVGGGLEYMFMPNWSLKAEYLYVDLGNHTIFNDNVGGGVLVAERERFSTNIFRGGLNYHFNFGGGPVATRY